MKSPLKFLQRTALLALFLGLPPVLWAQYRLEDYRAHQYQVPEHRRELWTVTPNGAEARVDHLVAFHSRADRLFSTREVANGATVSPLMNAAADITPVAFSPFSKMTLPEWMATQPITGLLVLHGRNILFERYQYDRNAQDKMLGNSMSKTVVGMLIGQALQDKSIESLDDLAEKYEPRLKGHPYGETSLRALLTMTSGMAYTEARDAGELWRRTAGQSMRSRGVESVTQLNTRKHPQGQTFNYNSTESQVLSLVLIGATGKSLAQYTSEKLWQPMGAEAPAFWMTDAAGTEAGFMGFNATLRDWGRLGLLWAQQGAVDGQAVVPASYLEASRAWRASGYGHHIWLPRKDSGQVAFLGVRGQSIFVDPTRQLVMVLTAVREQEYSANSAFEKERTAVWNHLLATIKTAPKTP